MKLAIMGGTGVYDASMFKDVEEIEIQTRYGMAVGISGKFQGSTVIFLTRHGAEHSIPPHKVNYRANIAALKKEGVTHIIATAAVGSLNKTMKGGHYVLVDQFLDFTKHRNSTFFDGTNNPVAHVDCTNPYCIGIQKVLSNTAKDMDLPLHSKGCYITTEGPRFESAAEIKMYRMLGGDIVGMTSVPEVVLAREAGIHYATLAMVTNFAAGISDSPLSHEEVVDMMKDREKDTKGIIAGCLGSLLKNEGDWSCQCPKESMTIQI